MSKGSTLGKILKKLKTESTEQFGEFLPVSTRYTNEEPRKFVIDEEGNAVLTLPEVFKFDPDYARARGFRDIQEYLWPFEEDVYLRSTNNPKDLDYLRAGTHRGSTNHATGEQEGGLSVARDFEYGGEFGGLVRGRRIGEGSDSEPLLDTDSLEYVRDISPGELQDAIRKKAEELGIGEEGLKALLGSKVFRKEAVAPALAGLGAIFGGAIPEQALASEVPTVAERAGAIPQATGYADSPSHPLLSRAADLAGQYNRQRPQRVAPALDMLLPLGQMPEEYLRTLSYGEQPSWQERLGAILGVL